MSGIVKPYSVWFFSVSEVLDVPPRTGDIPIDDLIALKRKGAIVGICGEWKNFVKVKGWQDIISTFGPIQDSEKNRISFLRHYRQLLTAPEFTFVSHQGGHIADSAGYRYLPSTDFSKGIR